MTTAIRSSKRRPAGRFAVPRMTDDRNPLWIDLIFRSFVEKIDDAMEAHAQSMIVAASSGAGVVSPGL